VVAGGPSLVAGLLTSSGLFGIIGQVFSFSVSPVMGDVAMLIAAVILLRLLPQGITGRFFKGKL
jgi:urea transport system permease protein